MAKRPSHRSRDGFFRKFKGGSSDEVFCIQIDIAGHSKWFESCRARNRGYDATAAKVRLAQTLDQVLFRKTFHKLFWAGDGGAWVASAGNRPGGNVFVVDAADRVLNEYNRWKRANRGLDTSSLGLRVCAHRFGVYTYSDPAFWTSSGLNWFLKNERDISIAGSLVLTAPVAEDLRRYRLRFRTSISKSIPYGEAPVKLYIDSRHRLLPTKGSQSLSAFLRDVAKDLGLPKEDDILPGNAARVRLGNALLIDGLFQPSQTYNILLEPTTDQMEECLLPAERTEVTRLAQVKRDEIATQHQEDRWYVNPLRIVIPLRNVPICRVKWRRERYSDTWAPQKFVVSQPGRGAWSRAARYALSRTGRRLPSRLTAQGIIITAPQTWGPDAKTAQGVILSQRNDSPAVDLEPNRWSASFEEGIYASEQETPAAPEAVERAASRALVEEFGVTSSRRPQLVGVQLERNNLSIGVMAALEVPLTYEEVEETWRTEAADKNEHVQLVGMPLLPEAILPTVKSGLVDRESKLLRVADGDTFASNTSWELHPTAALRLATALWLKDAWKAQAG